MTPPAAAQPDFTPPTPEQLREQLAAYTPRARPGWVRHLPIGVLVAAVLISLAMTTWWAALLPWLALGGLLVDGTLRMRRAKARHRRARYAQELAMLRYHREALRLGWVLLPELVHEPTEHGRVVTVLAHLLDDLGNYDAALVAFNHMLTGLPPQHPGVFAMNVQRAILFFHTDRLADGDDVLRKLRNALDPYEGTALGAAYHVARLIQSVKTHHFQEGVDDVPEPLATFRPLGVEAGYAHGLLALCLLRIGRRNDARSAWSRATLLLPASTLTARFPELRDLSQPGAFTA